MLETANVKRIRIVFLRDINNAISIKKHQTSLYSMFNYQLLIRGRQFAVCGPHASRHSAFSGPRKYSRKIFKSEIFPNISQQIL